MFNEGEANEHDLRALSLRHSRLRIRKNEGV